MKSRWFLVFLALICSFAIPIGTARTATIQFPDGRPVTASSAVAGYIEELRREDHVISVTGWAGTSEMPAAKIAIFLDGVQVRLDRPNASSLSAAKKFVALKPAEGGFTFRFPATAGGVLRAFGYDGSGWRELDCAPCGKGQSPSPFAAGRATRTDDGYAAEAVVVARQQYTPPAAPVSAVIPIASVQARITDGGAIMGVTTKSNSPDVKMRVNVSVSAYLTEDNAFVVSVFQHGLVDPFTLIVARGKAGEVVTASKSIEFVAGSTDQIDWEVRVGIGEAHGSAILNGDARGARTDFPTSTIEILRISRTP